MKTNECDCNNCENYEPKQAEPKYKVGDVVRWDGDWEADSIPARYVKYKTGTVMSIDQADDNRHKVDFGKTCWWIKPEHLSLLPDMYIGKVWTLEQEGHECYGLQMKCVAQDGIVHNYQAHVYGHNNTVSDLLTTGGCVKYSHNDYIINCIDPEFWTGKIEGEWVRCYEDEDGYVRLHTADDWDYIMDSDYPQLKAIQRAVWLSAIKAANIPIMPYAQSNGNYTPPTKEA